MTSRRDFVVMLGAGALGSMMSHRAPRRAAPSIRWGYASITWGGNDAQAIDDIASLGFAGVQLRSNVLEQFSASRLRDLLASRKLTFVALSSGTVRLGTAADERQMIDDHVAHARFVRDAGGSYLQVIDERPAGRDFTADDIGRLGRLLTEIGKRTADLGIPLGYHNHMGAIGEKPGDVERVLDASDPAYVRLELDIAHYYQGGGNPVEAIRRHADRLLFLHIKDVQIISAAGSGVPGYRFVELGRGVVDVTGVVSALRDVGFSGWAVIELDSVPPSIPPRTPKDCAAISQRYVERLRGRGDRRSHDTRNASSAS
jgi:inosose dehydratase